MTKLSKTILAALLLLAATASPSLQAGGGHAADDELALAAAQLTAGLSTPITTSTPGAPSGIGVTATLADPTDCVSNGSWSSVISWTPHIPVSAANLPDGRILTFASNQRTSFPGGPEFTYAATWNPATGVFQEFNNPSHDMFCGGITLMPDGRVMVNGGRNEVTFTSIFDWRTNTWTRVQNMNSGRWYNTSVSLPNGNVFTATGGDPGVGNGTKTTERWSSAGWTLMSGIGWPAVLGADAGYFTHWHPFVSLAPDGRLLHFGPTDTMHWFNVTGTGSFVNANATVPGAHYPKEGCWVMYDEGKILIAGGGATSAASAGDSSIGTSTNLAYTVNMSTNPPTVSATASMQYPRQFANTVVLPSGEVLVMGGNSPGQKFSDVGSILPCEIWNPKTGTWRTVASISVPRNYHSLALLLPDGRVLSGGGGLGGGDHQDAQLYSPPCFFTNTGALATRPVLNTAPAKVGPGSTFSVTGTAGLVKFSFIRMAALTHSVNTDQRYLSVPFTETSAGNYQLTAHSNLNVMNPGFWMLYGVNSTGAFSVAKIIQVDAASAIAVTNPGDQSSTVGTPVSLQITATGTGLTYSATGLPTGLTINSSTGLISGTPTTSGSSTVRVTASASGQSVSQDFTWFVLLSNTGTGKILREWWLNIPNYDLLSLTSNAAYPNSPTGSDQLTSFETPTDWADNLGQRVRGYVIPPVTGQYRFSIASDDEGRLILSTNNSPANGSIIAKVSAGSWTGSREWTKFAEQTSALITLQAGQPYYIEALMKEGGGGDNLAVAWQVPGSTGPAVIAGQYLSPWVINRAPTITNPGNRTNVLGNAVSLNVVAGDADNDALTFSATALPAGLAINSSTGVITGTPIATGTVNTIISVTDNKSPAVTASFTWTIVDQVNLNPVAATTTTNTGAAITYTATSTGGLNVKYKWSWGDGTADTALSSTASASHTYSAPGRYTITLTATDDTGRITTYTFYQAVNAALTAQRPTASTSIIYEARTTANSRVWTVNQDNNSVSVFDAVTRTRLAEITVGTAPRTLALAPNGNVWVTNVESGTLSIISGSTLAVVQTVTLPRGSRPFGVAFSPNGADGWVACEGTGVLLRMNPSTGAQVASLNIASDARHVSVSADSTRVFVTRFITPLLPGESTATVTTSNSVGAEVYSVTVSTLAVQRTVLLHSDRIDAEKSGRGIPNYLGPAIISPDGLTAWVPSKQDNIKRGKLRDGSDLAHDQTIRSIVSRIQLTSGSPAATDDSASRVDFDNAGIAVNGVFESKGIYLFTALEGSREVGIVDVWNKKELTRFSAGRAPQGIAISPDGRTVYVQNFMDRTITIHDVGAILDGRLTTPTLSATLNCITTERLTANVLLGKKHFYDSADRRIAFEQYISCASCHNDGGQDGRVWDFTGFGEGLRNTIALRGHGGTAQGPVHWSGNFDEIQDFENQIHTLPLGTGLITTGLPNPPLGAPNAGRSADLDALASYVASLSSNDASPYRNADNTTTASGIAGRQVFASNNCAACHSGSQFTDSAVNVLHDVGTIKPASGTRLGAALTGLDTPTLRGVWDNGPYLHDGSAPTLAAAIAAHTTVPRPSLGTQAMTDLVNFLLQIDDNETNPNRAPVVTTPANQSTVRGVAASLQIVASDPDGNPLTYSATGLPLGLTINGASGLISGTVSSTAAASNTVVITATDGVLSSTATFTWNTTAPVTGPNFAGADIGATGAIGSTTFTNGVYTVKGSGDNIFYNADAFQFASTAIVGDADIRARVTSMTNTGDWAKAGVMIRESSDANSRHAMTYTTPMATGNGFDMLYRTTTGGPTADTYFGGANPAPNNWVRLTRVGNVLTSYVSANGTTWAQVDAITFTSLPSTMLYGLGVTSYSPGTLCTATFDNVQIIGGSTPTVPAAPTNLTATAQSSSAIALTWTDVATNETGYRVERAIGTGSYSTLTTVAAGAVSYTDSGLVASTAYNYKVSAINSAGAGTAGPVTATTQAGSSVTFTGADIGSVAAAGSTAVSSGVYTVKGSGDNIFYNADAFHFASASITGDADIRARVTSMTNSGDWAKAGVMIRESAAPGARHAMTYTTPMATGNGFDMLYRTATDGSTADTYFGGANPAPNNWVRLTRVGNVLTSYVSANGTTWTQVDAITYTSLPASMLYGLAVTSYVNGTLCTATFDNVQVITGSPSTGDLVGTDIGLVAASGNTTGGSGNYTVKGSGDNIFYSADSFHFASTSVTGDADIRARLTSMTNTGAWAKAGVMIRESGAANARHAMTYATPVETGNGFEMLYRTTTPGPTADTYMPGPNAAPNNWLRLTRVGNVITSYVSANGSTWTQINAITYAALPNTMLYGLAVTSYANGTLCTATFDNVQIITGSAAPLSARVSTSLASAGSTTATTTKSALTTTQTSVGGTSLGFTRVIGSTVKPTLQIIDDLAQSPAGWRISTLAPTIVSNGDGTETLSYANLSSAFTGAQGFARIHIEQDLNGDGFADLEENGEVFGFNRRTYTTGTATFGNAFAAPAIATAQVTALQNNIITLSAPLPALTPGTNCYLEVTRGLNQGHRLDLDEASATGSRVLIEASPRNTLSTVPSTIIGDTVVIRAHQTVSSLFPERSFTGTTSPGTADRLMFFNGTNYEVLWLLRKTDGTKCWVRDSDATLNNMGSRIVDVTEGTMIQLRSAKVTLTNSGLVRPHRIALPLKAGTQLIANISPSATSLNALGLTTAAGFIATTSATTADRVNLLASDETPTAPGYRSLSLLTIGTQTQWTDTASATLANLSNAPLVNPTRALFIKSTTNKPTFMVPLTWRP